MEKDVILLANPKGKTTLIFIFCICAATRNSQRDIRRRYISLVWQDVTSINTEDTSCTPQYQNQTQWSYTDSNMHDI